MENFWKLFRESVIMQAIIALVLVSVISYLYIAGKEVPEALVQAFMLVLGFFFGSRSEYMLLKGKE
jgi:hypothetical protein